MIDEEIENGGAGSGNFGHAGRPGKVGGSAPYKMGYSKTKREVGQKYREALAPVKAKAKEELKKYRDLYRQLSKEHLDKIRQKYKQEYQEKRDYLKEQDKKQLKTDKEGMQHQLDYLKRLKDKQKYLDYKQEMKDKLAELKQKYKDTTNKELYGQKKHYKGVLEDIKQADKEKYKQLYQEQKDKIMGKYREEYETKKEEIIGKYKEEYKKKKEETQKIEQPIQEPKTEQTKSETIQKTTDNNEKPIPFLGDDNPYNNIQSLKELLEKNKNNINQNRAEYTGLNLMLNNEAKMLGWAGRYGKGSSVLLEKDGKQMWITEKDTTEDGRLTPEAEKRFQKAPQFDSTNLQKKEAYDITRDTKDNFHFKDEIRSKNGRTYNLDVVIPKTAVTVTGRNEYGINKSVYDKALKLAQYKTIKQAPESFTSNKDDYQGYDLETLKQEAGVKDTLEEIDKPYKPSGEKIEQTSFNVMGQNCDRNDVEKVAQATYTSKGATPSHITASRVLLNNKNIQVPITLNESVLITRDGKQLWINRKDLLPNGKLTSQAEKKLQNGQPINITTQNSNNYKYYTWAEIKHQMEEKASGLQFNERILDKNGKPHFITITIPKQAILIPKETQGSSKIAVRKNMIEQLTEQAIQKYVNKKKEQFEGTQYKDYLINDNNK